MSFNYRDGIRAWKLGIHCRRAAAFRMAQIQNKSVGYWHGSTDDYPETQSVDPSGSETVRGQTSGELRGRGPVRPGHTKLKTMHLRIRDVSCMDSGKGVARET
jgi:hypothetical protein